MALKITIIGAGSVVFAKRLVGDILQFAELADCTLCLMDNDPDRLWLAELMAKRMVRQLKTPTRVFATSSRSEAVRGANYVICTIQVGGYKPGTVIDFEIPRRYGLLQTIGDTLGVGGVFRGLRTIPAINAIARDIVELAAPDCLLLNYSNPMAMNCWAVDRATGIPHVGLCHSVQGTSRQLADYAGLPYNDVGFLVAGINHMAFFLKFEYKKQDAYPLLFQLLENQQFSSDQVRFEMMRRLGYFVTESSEHQSEYVPYFIQHGERMIRKFSIPIDEYLRRCETIINQWAQTEKSLLGSEDAIPIEQQSHEYGSYIIHSRETGIARVVYGNVPNRGLITNLPQGCCVELPCLVDHNGIQPTHIGDLPLQLAAICRTNINVQELTVEAALTGRREYIYQAVMLDPHTSSVLPLDKIWAMCDDLIEAHQKAGLMGDYQPVLRNTGRGFAGVADQIVARIEKTAERVESTSEEPLKLVITNPRTDSCQIELRLHLNGRATVKGGEEKFLIEIPAGGTVKQDFVVVRNSAAKDEEIHLGLQSDDLSVLTIDYVLRKRMHFEADQGGTVHFEMKLAGESAVTGKLTEEDGVLLVNLNVADSNVTGHDTSDEQPSLVTLFFANSARQKPHGLVLAPEEGGQEIRVTDLEGADVNDVQVGVEMMPNGYNLRVRVPRTGVGLSSKGPFLFDAIVRLSALGEAHSGGRTSLSGHFHSAARATDYVIINLPDGMV